MKVAFSSTEGVTVDQHFGSAPRFYVWDVGPEGAEYLGTIEVQRAELESTDVQSTDVQGRLRGTEDQEDRITARASALQGCAVVFTAEIGGPAAAKLVARRIHPVKAPQRPVIELVERFQRMLREHPPPWLRRILGSRAQAQGRSPSAPEDRRSR